MASTHLPDDGHSGRSLGGTYDNVHFDPQLKPQRYCIRGTSPDSNILFLDVNILDSTGCQPYKGDVYIVGERISRVGLITEVDALRLDPTVLVIHGRGRTLMSGLGDGHTHMSWTNGQLQDLPNIGVEMHTLLTADAARTYLDSGYTMCFGAASAKDNLDVVIRDAINEGLIPGPRLLANCKEIARREGELCGGITAFADGPEEMREVIQRHITLGADQVKLSMSGEEFIDNRSAEDCYFTDEETAACVSQAHQMGVRLCAHARAKDSVTMCVRHGVDVIYHASWTDEEGFQMLQENKSKHMVVPAIGAVYEALHNAGEFGMTYEMVAEMGYQRELDAAVIVLTKMHQSGIAVLPGGDYGLPFTPHGRYARDLEHFVNLLGMTPMESILAATAGIAKLFMQENELGKIQPGFYADCILVDGNPLEDITILQDHQKLNVIIINGRIHKGSPMDIEIDTPTPRFTSISDHSLNEVYEFSSTDSDASPVEMENEQLPSTQFRLVVREPLEGVSEC